MAANGAGVILSKNLTCNGSAGDAMSGFVGERHAVTIGTTGARSFAIDTQGIVYMRPDGATIDDALGGAIIFK